MDLKPIKKIFPEVTILNAIYCILIVFVHGSSDMITNGDRASWYYQIVLILWNLSFFAISGFFFLSSYKIFAKEEITNYKSYYINRILTIFLPYSIWTCIYYCKYLSLEYYDLQWEDLYKHIIYGTISGQLYFVIAIMQFYFLLPLWQWYVRKIPWHMGLILAGLLQYKLKSPIDTFLLNLFPEQLQEVLFVTFTLNFIFFWILGAYCGRYRELFLSHLQESKVVVTIFLLGLAGINMFLIYSEYVLDISSEMRIYFYHLYILFAILSSVRMVRNWEISKFIQMINANSYGIFLSHCFFLIYIRLMREENSATPQLETYLIDLCLLFLVTIISNYLYSLPRLIKKRKQQEHLEGSLASDSSVTT